MAATADLKFYQRGPTPGARYVYPVAAGVQIFRNAIVAITADKAVVPFGHADGVAAVGLALDPAYNWSGANDGARVLVGTGVFEMSSALPDAVPADLKKLVYATADDTLALAGAEGQAPLGRLDAIDAEGVWVRI